MSRVTVLKRTDGSIFYMVAVQGRGAPTHCHASPVRAFEEAKRLVRKHNAPASILMQIGKVFPKVDGSLVVANFGSGQWFIEHADA